MIIVLQQSKHSDGRLVARSLRNDIKQGRTGSISKSYGPGCSTRRHHFLSCTRCCFRPNWAKQSSITSSIGRSFLTTFQKDIGLGIWGCGRRNLGFVVELRSQGFRAHTIPGCHSPFPLGLQGFWTLATRTMQGSWVFAYRGAGCQNSFCNSSRWISNLTAWDSEHQILFSR